MPLSIVRKDLTTLRLDAVVCPAHPDLVPDGDLPRALFDAAGYDKVTAACQRMSPCPVGGAALTPGFDLPARYIFHAVAPVWQGGGHGEVPLLEEAYHSALDLTAGNGLRSVAIPLLSTGPWGFPTDLAMDTALRAIRDYLEDCDLKVLLSVFEPGDALLGRARCDALQSYLEDHCAPTRTVCERERAWHPPVGKTSRRICDLSGASPLGSAPKGEESASLEELEHLLDHLEEPFSTALLKIIDQKGMTDVEVYKRANLDRKLFSKLRKPDYRPGKPTVLALAIALRLTLEETEDLLRRAGYSLSRSSRFDVIVQYCIEQGIYDIFAVNEHLFAYDERLLG